MNLLLWVCEELVFVAVTTAVLFGIKLNKILNQPEKRHMMLKLHNTIYYPDKTLSNPTTISKECLFIINDFYLQVQRTLQ